MGKNKPLIYPGSIYAKLFPASGFRAEEWFGEPDKHVFGDLEKDFRLLLDNMRREDDSFDFSEFMSALCRIALIYGVKYENIQAVRLRSNKDIIVIVPCGDDVPACILTLINALTELHSVVRPYVGRNYIDDLVWGRYIRKTHFNLALSADLYVVDKLK